MSSSNSTVYRSCGRGGAGNRIAVSTTPTIEITPALTSTKKSKWSAGGVGGFGNFGFSEEVEAQRSASIVSSRPSSIRSSTSSRRSIFSGITGYGNKVGVKSSNESVKSLV